MHYTNPHKYSITIDIEVFSSSMDGELKKESSIV